MNWISRLRHRLSKKPHTAGDLATRAQFFNDASSDEEHYPSSIDPRIFHVKLVLDHLADCSDGWIADIGCGKGRFARIVQEHLPGSSVLAVDLATSMLAYVPQTMHRIAASMTALPFSTGSCRGAYATESLEHAVDVGAAVAELCRIVAPGGKILIIDKIVEHWGRFQTPQWEKWFDRAELEGLLRSHCSSVSSQLISYWEDVEPDGLFIAWLAVK